MTKERQKKIEIGIEINLDTSENQANGIYWNRFEFRK